MTRSIICEVALKIVGTRTSSCQVMQQDAQIQSYEDRLRDWEMDEKGSGSHPVAVLAVSEVLNLRICYHSVGQASFQCKRCNYGDSRWIWKGSCGHVRRYVYRLCICQDSHNICANVPPTLRRGNG
jgi:hypothetical protein